MIRKIFSYIIIASVLAVGFTACSDDDNIPKEKTPEEIAAENLAELKKAIGTGIGVVKGDTYENAVTTEYTYAQFTEQILDKIKFTESKIFIDPLYVKLINDNKIKFGITGMSITQDLTEVTKEGDILIMDSPEQNKKEVFYGSTPSKNEEHAVKLMYNTKSKEVTIYHSGYSSGQFAGTLMYKFKAKPFNAEKVSTKSVAARTISSAPAGVNLVTVKLKGQNLMTIIAASILKPTGSHYVKFTPKSNGKTQVQFCNAQGVVSGNNDATDYYYSTTNHFWKNRMPMALNLYDVDFSYTNGTISSGTNVMALARKNQNPNGFIPPFFGGTLTNQNSGADADIITTTGNTASSFKIEIKLDFEADFHCIITK